MFYYLLFIFSFFLIYFILYFFEKRKLNSSNFDDRGADNE